MPEILDHPDLPSNFTLRLMSDLQLGSITAARDLFDALLKPVRTRKDYRLAGLGDLFDNISPTDKRFSFDDWDEELAAYARPPHRASHTHEDPRAAKRAQRTLDGPRDWLEDKLTGIADRVIGLGIGNHELVGMNVTDPVRTICENLGIPYMGYSCIVRVNETTQMLLWHGRPSIGSTVADPFQRSLAVKRNLVRTNRFRWGDPKVNLIAQGHTNHLTVVRPEESRQIIMSYDWEGKEMRADYVTQDNRWYACCGSLQRAFVPGRTTYVEAKGLHPLPLGCVDVEFKNSQIHDVRPVYLG